MTELSREVRERSESATSKTWRRSVAIRRVGPFAARPATGARLRARYVLQRRLAPRASIDAKVRIGVHRTHEQPLLRPLQVVVGSASYDETPGGPSLDPTRVAEPTCGPVARRRGSRQRRTVVVPVRKMEGQTTCLAWDAKYIPCRTGLPPLGRRRRQAITRVTDMVTESVPRASRATPARSAPTRDG